MSDLMSLTRRLVLLYREMFNRVDAAMEAYEFGAGSYAYLLAVYYNEGATQQQLADRLQVDKAAATRVFCRLELQGYIERRKRPENRRETRVYCREKNRQVVMQIQQIIEREMKGMLCVLDESEQAQFQSLLAKLVQLPSNVGESPRQFAG